MCEIVKNYAKKAMAKSISLGRAYQMIKSGITDISFIAQEAGLTKEEVLKLKKEYNPT